MASEAASAQQDEAALLVFDVLAAAGQQLNGSARWSLPPRRARMLLSWPS